MAIEVCTRCATEPPIIISIAYVFVEEEDRDIFVIGAVGVMEQRYLLGSLSIHSSRSAVSAVPPNSLLGAPEPLVYLPGTFSPHETYAIVPISSGALARRSSGTWKKSGWTSGALDFMAGERVAGSILRYRSELGPEVSYWIGREFWGRGIASEALRLFLIEQPERPMFARVAKDNSGSHRVLEKSGFVVIAEERGFAEARAAEIDELVLRLG